MKEINAFWEKRNLGVDVKEIEFEEKDELDALGELLYAVHTPYSVLRIASGRTDALLLAQEQGYRVIEMSIGLEGKTDHVKLPEIYRRFESAVSVSFATPDVSDQILKEIKKGEIFETDRIALDPYYSKSVAGNRYYNWTKDELDKGARLAVAYYKNAPAAFGVTCQKDHNCYDAFLGGNFSEMANKGLGFLAIYANMKAIQMQGGTKIVTRVSSNNQPILRLHMQYGYMVKDMKYVLIRHQ